jgi:LysR family nitrogen assimilation transcriptional regulator
MDFNKLRIFLIVAEEGSVTRAAQRLLRTQPAVSQALRLLEEDLGIALLHRGSGKIYLTPEGEAVFKVASQSLATAEQQILQISTDKKLVAGVIAVAVIANFGSQFVIDSLVPFRRRFPGVDFQVEYVPRSGLAEEKLLKGEVDVAVSGHFKDRRRLEVRLLARQRHILVASRDFIARTPPMTSVASIAACPAVIDFSADFIGFRSWLKANGQPDPSILKSRRPAFVIQDQSDAKEAVLRGLGIAVLPERLVRDGLERGLLVEVLRHGRPVEVGINLAFRKRRTPKFIIDEYLKFLCQGQEMPRGDRVHKT